MTPAELRGRLDAYCAAEGVTASTARRRALEAFLAAQPLEPEWFLVGERSGLVYERCWTEDTARHRNALNSHVATPMDGGEPEMLVLFGPQTRSVEGLSRENG